MTQSFTQTIGVKGESGVTRKIPAGIVAPLKIRNRTVGALKFYFSSPRAVNRTQYALVAGFSELLSTQLAIHALEQQEELTARAEVRALQAQINPHFLVQYAQHHRVVHTYRSRPRPRAAARVLVVLSFNA